MNIWNNWKILSLLSLVFWGLWGYLSKVSGSGIDWKIPLALFSISMMAVMVSLSPSTLRESVANLHTVAILAGITGAIGFLFFYRALHLGPASTVIPITSMYIVVAVLLAFFFSGEAVTVRKSAGILLAVASIALLSSE